MSNLSFKIIKNDVDKNRLAGAYLFVGNPDDCSEVIKQVSSYLTCLNEDKPCGSCRNCMRIESGNHPDIITVKPSGKGNFIKISDIAEIQDLAYIKPIESEKRICILKNIEKMDTEASNSFLKTLEEPPESTIFFLALSNIHSILDTIVSRCRRIFVEQNKKFDQAENLTIQEDYIFEIRDKIIDIVCKNIGQEDILDEIDKINQVIKKKSSVKEHTEIILNVIESFARDLIIFKETEGNTSFIFNKDKIDTIKDNCSKFSYDIIYKLIDKITETKMLLDFNPNFKITMGELLLCSSSSR